MVTGIHLAKILQIILQYWSIYDLFVLEACKLVNLCSFISFESDVMNYLAVMTQCRVMADRGDFVKVTAAEVDQLFFPVLYQCIILGVFWSSVSSF